MLQNISLLQQLDELICSQVRIPPAVWGIKCSWAGQGIIGSGMVMLFIKTLIGSLLLNLELNQVAFLL